jgi:vacuolar protein-sorting-associated protein 4
LNLFDEVSDKYYSQLKAKLRESILIKKPQIGFKDIAGNDYAKEIIKETFIIRESHPSIFKNKVRPWQSILLYGPPGVGKTMLALSVCHHSKSTCFWVSSADITSKFIGESEKLLNMLFEIAREEAPSIILIDEMDSLGRTRTGSESETERRIKTEFLKQMDKIRTIDERVSVFATTNMPWEMDIAALRRFERKILVPMPNREARKKIMELHAGTLHMLSESNWDNIAS